MRLKRFVGSYGEYVFPPQTDGTDNFKEVVPRTTRQYAMDGGIDEYMGGRAPQAIGNVRVGWWVFGDASGSVTDGKDAAFAMTDWGVQALFIQPEKVGSGIRWVNSRVNNIQVSENVRDMPHLRNRVQANFQAAQPFWQGSVSAPRKLDEGAYLDKGLYLDGALYLDDGRTLDSGWQVGAPKAEINLFNNESVTVTNYGNHTVMPRFEIGARQKQWVLGESILGGDPPFYLNGWGAACNDITVRQIYRGKTINEFRWSGTLASGEWIEVDSAKQTVRVVRLTGHESGYGQFSKTVGFGFPTLPPGETTYQVTGNFGETGCYLAVHAQDAWY